MLQAMSTVFRQATSRSYPNLRRQTQYGVVPDCSFGPFAVLDQCVQEKIQKEKPSLKAGQIQCLDSSLEISKVDLV